MPSEPHDRNADTDVAERATPVELFFDVVFVLTVTQLANLLETNLNWAGVGQTVMILGLLWYLYSAYAWLTNHVPPRRPTRKLLLFGGMAGFLLTAVAIPDAFTGSGLLFGIGYLIVVTVHVSQFAKSTARAAVRRFAPYNLGGAALILAAGLLTGPVVPVLWVAAIFTQTVLPYLLPGHSWLAAAASFHIRPAHFVERHGLLVIVALGETVVAIGMGARVDHLDLGVAGAVVMALALPATLWWTYFTDTAAGEAALDRADQAARSRLSARVYVLNHFALLLGIIATATGLHAVVAHPDTPAGWPAALALTAGVALFLAAIADLRHSLDVGRTTSRVVTAALVLASTPLGATVNSALHLGVVIILMVVMLLIDGYRPGAPLSHAAHT
ncbi:low temperature requirement protein A [Micromonospora inositola]|uniref:Low temperature requirement protein LtrA n=1 Tax=Micromonospora inositola TaxID=47865 RepID=A0A1C5INR8_9ACTN|nr:low temperature requirement protein A [Micromonospora inositola]SCG59793.1 Low temperature requirement protein LtrA [Micromonospora inositola]